MSFNNKAHIKKCILLIVIFNTLLINSSHSQRISHPGLHYEFNIAKLNRTTPIPIVYNEQVEKYIQYYGNQRKEDFAKYIGLSQIYFPIFEEYLDKNNLPLELKYIAVIESGLNPLAQSKSGAFGLWQFKFNSARLFDLSITSYIDDRADVYKSTQAACKYFTYLYSIYKDWQLVIASYNGGPGETRNAIYNANGETDFWKLQPYMAEQTQNYLPSFIAAMYIFNYYSDFNIVPVEPIYSYEQLDTLSVNVSFTFTQIAQNINLDIEHLQFLNPTYRTQIIPESDESLYIVLPTNKVQTFIKYKNSIIATHVPQDDYHSSIKKMNDTGNKTKVEHVVKKGEYFHKIAMQYNCSIESIKTWNNLDSNAIHPGQKLIIYIE